MWNNGSVCSPARRTPSEGCQEDSVCAYLGDGGCFCVCVCVCPKTCKSLVVLESIPQCLCLANKITWGFFRATHSEVPPSSSICGPPSSAPSPASPSKLTDVWGGRLCEDLSICFWDNVCVRACMQEQMFSCMYKLAWVSICFPLCSPSENTQSKVPFVIDIVRGSHYSKLINPSIAGHYKRLTTAIEESKVRLLALCTRVIATIICWIFGS